MATRREAHFSGSGPWPARLAAERLVRTLRDAGHVAYFAGGCVRDELLGLPAKDYDVATDAVPERVAQLFPRTQQVGVSFGVVLVKVGRGHAVEVATFRSDGRYSDARRPDSVRFSSPEEDAARRDFTINALFLDPLRPGPLSAQVIDFVGGLADLETRTLRAVGVAAERLAEDHLRALRAVRLSSRLGFSIHADTASAIRDHAAALRGVSRERIGEELRKMLTHATRVTACRRLAELGLEVPVLQTLGSGQRRLETPHLAALPTTDVHPGIALAAWALDLGVDPWTAADAEGWLPLVRAWRQALCLSNDETATLGGICAALHAMRSWDDLPIAKRKRLAASDWFAPALTLLGVTQTSASKRLALEVGELAKTFGGLSPVPVLTGDHLVAAGFRPGPWYREVLDGVYDAQLEGRVKNLDEALKMARTLGGPKRPT
jgi:tRNA nucleotidyltransferase/poly(A) polymerase